MSAYRPFSLFDCNTLGAMTLGFRAAGFNPLLAQGPTDGHALDYLSNNREDCGKRALGILEADCIPNVFRILPEVDTASEPASGRIALKKPRSAKATHDKCRQKSAVRLRTADYKGAKPVDIDPGAYLVATIGDLADGLNHRNAFRDRIREIALDVDCLTMQVDRLKPKHHETAAFIDVVQTVKPKTALAIMPFLCSLPLHADMQPVVRHYDDFIRSWMALRYVVVPFVFDATTFGAAVSRPQCAVIGVRNDIFNRWMTSSAFTNDDAVLWQEAALRAKHFQSTASSQKMLPFSDVQGWIAGEPALDDFPPFPLTPENAAGTLFESVVFCPAKEASDRTTYQGAVERNLVAEPFWDPSMDDLDPASDASKIPTSTVEWTSTDGFCDLASERGEVHASLPPSNFDILMRVAEEDPASATCVTGAATSTLWPELLGALKNPNFDGGASEGGEYETGADRDQAISKALVHSKSDEVMARPVLKDGIPSGIAHKWLGTGIETITLYHMRKWLFFRLLGELPAEVRQNALPTVECESLPASAKTLELYRSALKELLSAQLEFQEENGRFSSFSGNARQRFTIGGTLLAYGDEKLTGLVLELRNALEDLHAFDLLRASLSLRKRFYVQPRWAPIRFMPLLQLWHPDLPRPISYKEMAVCQGFPKSFSFAGSEQGLSSNRSRERMITRREEVVQAVSPLAAYAFGQAMKKILMAAEQGEAE